MFHDKKENQANLQRNTNINKDEYEEWEGDTELYYKEDYKALIKLREKEVNINPTDIYAQWRIGEAYFLNHEYEKSIEYLSLLHQKEPDFLDAQYTILDSLFALGKNEDDFNWVKAPIIYKLGEETISFCYSFIKKKRKHQSITDIYSGLLIEGYLAFNAKELFSLLSSDDRFSVEESSCIYDAKVNVVKKIK